jgi:predicted small metal-binding protein
VSGNGVITRSGKWYAYQVEVSTEGRPMTKVLNCECGYTVRGKDDEELLDNVERHVAEQHPDLVGTVTREDLLSMAEEE